MKQMLLFLCVIFFYSTYSLFAEEQWTHYTTDNGLLSNNVNSIITDSDGSVWIGTNGGVCKFNGTLWTAYTTSEGLVNNIVYTVAIDAEGNKWFGTDYGISKFDGTTWTNYTVVNTGGGLADPNVLAIAFDSSGNAWIGTYGGGVNYFDGNTWITYNKTTTQSMSCRHEFCIAFDSHHNVWFGTLNGGVNMWDGSTFAWYTTGNSQIPHKTVYAIAIDSNDVKWFGTGNGISRFDGVNWVTYSAMAGVSGHIIKALTIDKEGNLWAGADPGGVNKYDGLSWTTLTTDDGLINNSVLAISFDSLGNKWFGTKGGISVLGTANTSPTPSFIVSPDTGTTATVFTFDASASTDAEDSSANLQVRWDWENDGVWDTDFTSVKTASHSYDSAGIYVIKLEVKDSGNLQATVTDSVLVTYEIEKEIVVTVSDTGAALTIPIDRITVKLIFHSGNVSGKTLKIVGHGAHPTCGCDWSALTKAAGYFTIVSTDISDFSATLSFTYPDGLINELGLTEENLEIVYWENFTWKALVTTVDLENCVSTTINTFTRYSLADSSDPVISAIAHEPEGSTAESYQLAQNYPNPFNPMTTIEYQLKRPGKVSLTIYNTLGQLVRELVNTAQSSGIYSVQWDGRNDSGILVPSGVYLYRLKSDSYIQTKKMLFVK